MLQQIALFDQLMEEHGDVKKLLSEAEECEESEREDILMQIEKALVPHARGEEKTLYSVMRERATDERAQDLTAEAYEEHRVVDKLLADLKATDTDDEQWIARLKVLKENIEHHVEEEEGEVFEEAQKLFEPEEFDALLTAYQVSKEEYMETLPTQAQISSRIPSKMLEQSQRS